MKQPFSNKTLPQKIAYIITKLLQLAIIIAIIYEIVMSIKTGSKVSSNIVLYIGLLYIPTIIYNIFSNRNERKGNRAELKQYDKIVIRSILITIVIMTCLIVGTVLYAINS